MLFKKQDLIHLQEQQEANSEVLETRVLLRFENKQSSADLDNHGGIQGKKHYSSAGVLLGRVGRWQLRREVPALSRSFTLSQETLSMSSSRLAAWLLLLLKGQEGKSVFPRKRRL